MDAPFVSDEYKIVSKMCIRRPCSKSDCGFDHARLRAHCWLN